MSVSVDCQPTIIDYSINNSDCFKSPDSKYGGITRTHSDRRSH